MNSLYHKLTMHAVAVTFGLLNSVYSADEAVNCFNQKTTILSSHCTGATFDSLIHEIKDTFSGSQRIVDLTPDKRAWIVTESTADQFVIQNLENPFAVEPGAKLTPNGMIFKENTTVPHVTVVGPESSWWKAGTTEIPMEKVIFQDYIQVVRSCPSLEFTIGPVKTMGRWFVAALEPTSDTIVARSKLIAPYEQVLKEHKLENLPQDIEQLIKEKLDTAVTESLEVKKARALEISEELWKLTANMDEKTAFQNILTFFVRLTNYNISPYTFGFWFTEDKHPQSSCVISLMKIMSDWKAHLSLMPILTGEDYAIGDIIERDKQPLLLKTTAHQKTLEKLNEIIEPYIGKTITLNTISINQNGVLYVEKLAEK